MEFRIAFAEDRVSSTKDSDPTMQLFLDAGTGNVLAFFERPTRQPMDRDRNTPEWAQHLAFEVENYAALLAAKKQVAAEGIDVVGPSDHGIFQSISTSSHSSRKPVLGRRPKWPRSRFRH